MIVIAAKGTQCPMEGNPKAKISDSRPREVPDTIYYRRLVKEGSLLPAPARLAQKTAQAKTVKKAGSQPEAAEPKD